MDNKEYNGWLARDGHFFPCENGKYNEWAMRELHISGAALETLGWLRIALESGISYGGWISPAQVKWLRGRGVEIKDVNIISQK